jgi:hypothetical protein
MTIVSYRKNIKKVKKNQILIINNNDNIIDILKIFIVFLLSYIRSACDRWGGRTKKEIENIYVRY